VTEVCLAQRRSELVVVAALLGGIPELEARIIVAAVLEVHDPQLLAIVDVVLGQEVVVAGHRWQGVGRERPLHVCQGPHPRTVAVWNANVVFRDDPEVVLRRSEHVEVLQESRRRVQAAQRGRHSRGHVRAPQRRGRHGLSLDEGDHHHRQVGEILEDRWTDARGGRRLRIVSLVAAVDGEEIGPRSRDPNDVPRPVGFDDEVLVREPSGQRGHTQVARAAPEVHALHDLVDPHAPGHERGLLRSGS
jgi:hypothetical protein